MVSHRKKNQTSEGAAPSRNMTIGLAVGGGLLLAALSMQRQKIDSAETLIPPPTPQPGRGPLPGREQPFSPPPRSETGSNAAGSPGSNAAGSPGSNATGANDFMMIANAAFANYSANGVTMNVVERFTFASDLKQDKFGWLAVDMPEGYKRILTQAVEYWVAATRLLVTQAREEMAGWLNQYYITRFKP